jgi:predicted HTH transcriptional regulator
MGNRQSDARNKIIAPVFKHLGIIDQWGNGLTLIAEELKEYPQIDFRWKDVGLSFQIQFVNLDYVEGQELRAELGQEQELQQELRAELGAVLGQEQELQQELQNKTLYSDVLVIIAVSALSRNKISKKLGQKTISGQLNKVLLKLIENKLIEYTIPDNPTHPAQKFRLSDRGKTFLKLLKNK